jgi:hypothetical protein
MKKCSKKAKEKENFRDDEQDYSPPETKLY